MDKKITEIKFLWTDPSHIIGMLTIEEWREYSKGIEFQETDDDALFRNAEWVRGIKCKYNLNYYRDAKEIATLLYLETILMPKTVFPMAFMDDGGNVVILVAPAVDDDEPIDFEIE